MNAFLTPLASNSRSKGSIGHAFTVLVFHLRRSSQLFYTSQVISQSRTRVKLNRVFFSPLILPSPLLVLSWLFDTGKDPECVVPSPSPADTRRSSLHASRSSSPPTVDGFGTGTPSPSIRANPFPGLHIHFSDFSCLHCSIDKRLFTLRPDAL
ncbi:unnamed protein product [Brassica napus]|uniref:(rape) hypothetical protein n=1 Tax=Brassica napus TaxID=3708 RepID=A0A816P3J5_BRANA|nr:unnamed protein product [Brassica napus]